MLDIKEYTEKLKKGEVMLYPTDTIWGVGCDATNEEACQKISQIKNRPNEKSFIILVDGFPMLERYVPDFHEVCYELCDNADKPLTVIYPTSRNIAPSAIAEDGSIGIRITKDPLCVKLIRALKKPLLSTSANISGKTHPLSFDEISNQIKNGVDFIVEDRLKDKMDTPSQIIKIDLNGSVKIIRN